MNPNNCEAVLHLHRTFRPRRRTGRGFLTGTVFLDASLLFSAFLLAVSPFVQKPGITLDLPAASRSGGIRFNDLALTLTREGLLFFRDERVDLETLASVLSRAAADRPDAALILEADRDTPHSMITAIYDAAAAAGFRQVFIATQNTTNPVP
jgi:biopolymer transport protein ExbD